ncbi:SIR2 family NAD-dependent protein deacylase [Enterococcus mundtii]|uniref:SIR2 family NAD-dependent protein deacylase n=1 Tax=Enterococcus mundtii TaxID=53346 RepID=UPI0029545066|nr:SIR2 family protein [Enterococcus mundtii]MDV7746282.1 SIR2 family protein [Enterococcus mundtii]
MDYILTTNYDKLIEKTDALKNNLYSKSKNILTFEGFQMLEDSQFIFHIHGDIDLLGSMVVTNSDYETLYENEANKRILTGLINKRSMLFLGFSLKDKYFSEEFTNICESNKGYCTNYFVMINGNEGLKSEILRTNNVDFVNIKTSSPNDYNIKEQFEFFVDYILGEIVI